MGDEDSARAVARDTVDPPIHSLPNAFSLDAPAVAAALATQLDQGLSNDEAVRRQTSDGFNELTEAPRTPAWKRFASHFLELVIIILIVAAVISALLGEWTDALAILAIVLLNGILGFVQESRAEQALASLRKLSSPLSKVIRGGVPASIPARELVPGDRVELEAGDYVPADVRLIRAFGCSAQEAALTGESTAVQKEPEAVLPATTALGDRRNMAYMATIITAGKASAIVAATGMETELGKIAGLLEAQENEPTPLQRRLAELGKVMAIACLGIVALVATLQLLRGGGFLEVFMLAVSLAVAAVPEGLPAVVTVALALGLQRMVKRNALIRKLPSVETLGCVSVICSDKTGTLTRNEMTVREIVTPSMGYRVAGIGYTPKGDFEAGGKRVDPAAHADLRQALTAATWCNSARLTSKADGWQVVGDPTEGALLVAAMKAGLGIERSHDQGEILFEIPFDSDRKAMSAVVRQGDGATMFTKGAPEVVLRLCTEELQDRPVPLSEERRAEILNASTDMASRALRVLGLAYRPVAVGGPADYCEEKLVFAGLVGMIDPPRDEVKQAVATCHEAGIRPVMITGDHPATALAIAKELHIADADSRVVTGHEIGELSDEELAGQVEQISVYARVSAEHKLRVVRAWRSRGQVVAMTGDGVNDAPAVKEADIGIAMGVTGTDVTKDASDMVLMDDNFASIVAAVEEGRCIYANIQKVIQYLLSCNVGEILLMLVASLAGWPAPLIPVQLLWINLVTDGLPALALSFEPAEPGIMKRRPRPAKESILTWRTGGSILFQGALVAAATLTAFGIVYGQYPDDPGKARTVAFCVLVYGELLRAFVARSESIPLWRLGFFSNMPLMGAIALSVLLQMSVVTMPFARPFFESAEHFGTEWLLIVLLAPLPAVVIELTKFIKRGSIEALERGVT